MSNSEHKLRNSCWRFWFIVDFTEANVIFKMQMLCYSYSSCRRQAYKTSKWFIWFMAICMQQVSCFGPWLLFLLAVMTKYMVWSRGFLYLPSGKAWRGVTKHDIMIRCNLYCQCQNITHEFEFWLKGSASWRKSGGLPIN